MDPASHDMFHQRLNELIYDEEKIITCMSIASELNVSSSDAKHILETFVKDYGQVNPNLLHVTYLLCGSLKDSKGFAVYLVRENDLKTKKALYDVISTEAVYSLQKSEVVDFNLIALTNKDSEAVKGLITSKNCVVRDIKKKLPITQNAPSDRAFVTNVKNPQSNTEKNLQTQSDKNKKHESPKAKQTKMFTKQNSGIKSFFNKAQAPSEITKKTQELEEEVNVEEEQKTIKMEHGFQSDEVKIEEDSVEKMDTGIADAKTGSQKHGNNSKKRKKTNKNDAPNKKRKRIQEICDSDSDIFEEENEDVIELSDEEPPMQITTKLTPPPKNKRRKAVDKTYMDDEGFIVTNTEYVYESASDEENEAKNGLAEQKVLLEKKNDKENKQVESKPPASKGKSNKKPIKGKQPTLMSFFKKN